MSTSTKWPAKKAKSSEMIAVKVASMTHSQLKRTLISLRTRFRLDFTEEFLDSLSKNKLQHILMAAYLKAR